MPGVTLHFVVADRALSRWRAGSAPPPFDLDDPPALNAFYHGAVGPDFGYFPGGHRVLSDLAHSLRTGVLARALLASARTPRERAFALGWLTHLLADVAIHPWIGRGVGEFLFGSRKRFVDGVSHPHAHLRVEMGLDALYARRYPEVSRRRLTPVFGRRDMGFLIRGYAVAYGVVLPVQPFVQSHWAATHMAGQALASMRIVAALTPGAGTLVLPAFRRVIRAAYRVERLRSLALAYLTPVAPSEWLVEATEAAVCEHTDRFLAHVQDGAATLTDLNLDTGRPLAFEHDNPGARRALEGLATLAGPTPRLSWSSSALAHQPEPKRA